MGTAARARRCNGNVKKTARGSHEVGDRGSKASRSQPWAEGTADEVVVVGYGGAELTAVGAMARNWSFRPLLHPLADVSGWALSAPLLAHALIGRGLVEPDERSG